MIQIAKEGELTAEGGGLPAGFHLLALVMRINTKRGRRETERDGRTGSGGRLNDRLNAHPNTPKSTGLGGADSQRAKIPVLNKTRSCHFHPLPQAITISVLVSVLQLRSLRGVFLLEPQHEPQRDRSPRFILGTGIIRLLP